MSFRNKCLIAAALTSIVPLFLSIPLLPASSRGGDLVNLTILYTGDEYGYLEPCG